MGKHDCYELWCGCRFLNNRLTAELDVYNKVTDGILTTPNLHLTMGIKTPPTMNTAEVTNRGLN